jgi:ribonuclease inhibitor
LQVIVLDMTDVHNAAQFHEQLSKVLELPEWYGHNLDALWDVLEGWIALPLKLKITGAACSADRAPDTELGIADSGISAIIDLLHEAAEQIEQFELELE